jgi:hypothetical protein
VASARSRGAVGFGAGYFDLSPSMGPFESFQRSFRVPDGINADKIEANFKNGVLTIMLSKTPEALKKEKKITVKAG